ncbi:MAG: biopolymer transporter ExbD [Muribaculaceae bacterium]|nr:biopolymer transporter ExbD [Muribaculaceae bacterium]
MALRRQNEMLSTFSMASMTDVIFLLLIFFMVTSTFVLPTAMEVNLPQGSAQTAIKPGTKVYIDKEQQVYGSFGDNEPVLLDSEEQLVAFLQLTQQNNPEQSIALYADETVPYGTIVKILDRGSKSGLKIVLATKPVSHK